MIPRISHSFSIVRIARSTVFFGVSFEILIFVYFTNSKITEIASAVFRSSSIAASNRFVYPSNSASTETSEPSTSAGASDFNLSTAVRIRSRPFLDASTRSAEKFNGLL